MASDAANREAARDALAALIETEMSGTGKTLQAVYNSLPSDFGGLTPVVTVSSAGTDRKNMGIGDTTKWNSRFRLAVVAYVADAAEDDSWTDQDVEDMLDLIDKELADVIADNRESAGNWGYLELEEGFTEPLSMVIGGEPYVVEPRFVIARVIDD